MKWWYNLFVKIEEFVSNFDWNKPPEQLPMNAPDTTPPVEPVEAQTTVLLWDTDPLAYVGSMPYSVNGRHSVRVLCDDMGLTVPEKNIIAACVMQESKFMNLNPDGSPVTHKNMVGSRLASTDIGIVQCNDYWHIGAKKDFPSVEYVVDNPEVMVRWMIQCYKDGRLNLWSSYSTGAYKQWLNKV